VLLFGLSRLIQPARQELKIGDSQIARNPPLRVASYVIEHFRLVNERVSVIDKNFILTYLKSGELINTFEMKTSLYYISILLLFFYSCKKEQYRVPVFAGIYDSTFTYHEYTPPLKVNLKLYSQNNFYVGADSLDINSDGNFDLIIKQRMYLDKIQPIYLTDDNNPYCLLVFKNGLEFSTKIEYIYRGQGDVGHKIGIDTLSYDSRIDNISEWSGDVTNAAMWLEPSSNFYNSRGNWYFLTNAEMYIGLRMKINSRYKFGWIKVNELSRENISFISYAIEN